MKVALVFSAILMTQLVSQIQGLVVTTEGTAMDVDCENVATTISQSDTNYGRLSDDTPITSLTFTRCDDVDLDIGDAAFGFATLQTLTLPNQVTTIGSSAFQFSQLTSLTIPASVTSIGGSAFDARSTLTTLVLETSISVGTLFRYYNALTSVTFAEGTTTISDYAFNAAPLVSLTIPASVTSIGSGAFNAAPLVSLTIPASVTSIGSGAFNAARLTLTTLVLESNVEIGSLFYQCPLTSLTLPDGMTSIGGGAFYNAQLTSLTLPDGIKSIGSSAFRNSFFTKLTLPSSLQSIGTETFKGSMIHTLYVPASLTTVTNTTLNTYFSGNVQSYESYNNRYSFLGSDAIPCMYAVYEPRDDWANTPYLCRKQINYGGSTPCNSHACPFGTSVRYDVESCASGPCTNSECCGVPIDTTKTMLYSEEDITQLKNTVSGLMTGNADGACEFNA